MGRVTLNADGFFDTTYTATNDETTTVSHNYEVKKFVKGVTTNCSSKFTTVIYLSERAKEGQYK